MNRARTAPALAALGLCALLAGPLRAELVVLSGGEVLKVKAYEAGPDAIRFQMPSGGFMTLSVLRVERILDDEVLATPDPLPAQPSRLALRFDVSQPVPDGPYGALIYETARAHGLNPQVVAAVARAESAFNGRAVSPKGACGLMQLMPATGERFGLRRSELFDPEKNLKAGATYLAWLAEHFAGDLAKVLAAYNAGEGSVERYDGVPPYRETRNYVRRIYASLGASSAADFAVSSGS